MHGRDQILTPVQTDRQTGRRKSMGVAGIGAWRSRNNSSGSLHDMRVVASLAALIAAALMIVAAAVYLGSRRQDELQAQGE